MKTLMTLIKNCIKKVLGEKRYLTLYLIKEYLLCSLLYFFGNRKKIIGKKYFKRTGKYLNINNPRTFNDKINWLKLNYYDEKYNLFVDKYRVREIVTERGCAEILNELYGVYNNANEIDWDNLPEKFILKVNNGCGHHIICTDKGKLNIKEITKKLNSGLKINYAVYSCERPYSKVQPKIICEKLLFENNTYPIDYKVFCYSGEPKYLYTMTEREIKSKLDFYDLDFIKLPIKLQKYENSCIELSKPENFNTMIEMARKLSQGLPFVRVDFYNINGKIIFGEYTFFPSGGYKEFVPDEYNYKFGEMLKLPS